MAHGKVRSAYSYRGLSPVHTTGPRFQATGRLMNYPVVWMQRAFSHLFLCPNQ